MFLPRTISLLLASSALLFAATAAASSWQWRDASGRMVYSDRAPPPDVPASRIVRTPGQPAGDAAHTPSPSTTASGAGVVPTAESTSARTAAATSWAERELQFRKRAAEREEAESRQREEREQGESAKRACAELRNSLRTLESGQRVAIVNTRGETEPIDDAQRSRRIETARKDLERHCGASAAVAKSN